MTRWVDLLDRWALDAVAHADALARSDPTWGARTQRIADGWLVLWGAGMFVNRAMRVGIDGDLGPRDLLAIETVSRRAGVDPAIEVTPETRPATRALLVGSRWTCDHAEDVDVLIHRDRDTPRKGAETLQIDEVRDGRGLRAWQRTANKASGHTDPRARAASDAFAAAAFTSGRDVLLLASLPDIGDPVGCAALTVNGPVATLGAMSTVPSFRRRGVQAALVGHRIQLAARLGCPLVSTSAVVGGASSRNLQRLGFEVAFTIETWTPP